MTGTPETSITTDDCQRYATIIAQKGVNGLTAHQLDDMAEELGIELPSEIHDMQWTGIVAQIEECVSKGWENRVKTMEAIRAREAEEAPAR